MNAPHPAPIPDAPDWLEPVEDRAPSTIPDTPAIRAMIAANHTALQELEQQTFGIAFEMLLEQMAAGMPLSEFCRTYHTPLPASKLRTWIYRNPKRRNAYLAAKAIGAEAVEDEMIRISDAVRADGSEIPEDVARSNLRISTRKWLLQVWNRNRYGDKTVIEQNTTTRVDTSGMSSDELRNRLLASMGVEVDSDAPPDYSDAIDG